MIDGLDVKLSKRGENRLVRLGGVNSIVDWKKAKRATRIETASSRVSPGSQLMGGGEIVSRPLRKKVINQDILRSCEDVRNKGLAMS